MKISIKINHLLDIFHQYLISIKFNPTSFSLIKKILDCGNYFFKKPQLSKFNNKFPVSNTFQSNEEHHCSHDYSRMGFLDGCNASHSNNNHFIKDTTNPIGIVSNRGNLMSNSDVVVLPVTPVLRSHPTISLKEVYENLVKSNTAKLKTYQLFEKIYEQRKSCNGETAAIISNNSSVVEKYLTNPLSELYPIHYFKNIEQLEHYSEDCDSSINITELQNFDDSNNFENMDNLKDSNDVGTDCSLSIITNHFSKDELDSYCLDIDEQSESGSASDIASSSLADTDSVSYLRAATATPMLTDIPMVNHNDVEHKEIVLDDCSEEMKTLISDFSLNLKSVIDNNPIELTVKHPLFSVSYENNPYFSVKDTPHIGYNSLMELEQDKELMVFPLCFYIKSVSLAQHDTSHKLFLLLEEQIDEDSNLSLDYVDNIHSGRIGLIYVSKSDIRKHYNVKRITQKIQDEVKLEAIRFVQLLNQ